MRAAIYIRVSTEEQAKEGYSISAQKQKLKAYCIAQDWEAAGFYVDEGISAKDMNRPQLKQMIEDIKADKIDCVLVYRLDRLTRSVLDLYKMLQTFEKYDCKFKSATEVFETTTAIGRMFITIVAAMAQWERENLGERVKMGMVEKLRQGKYVNNISPFGYDLDLKNGTLSINESEAKIVRLMADLYLQGYGGSKICQYLNERNILTKKGNPWIEKPVMQILKNPLYMGTIKWAGELSEDSVPPILDKKTYDNVQLLMQRRRELHPQQVSSQYIFSGALRCPNCGYALTGYTVGHILRQGEKKGEKIYYKNYRCLHKKTGLCSGSKAISEIKLDKQFINYLESLDFTSVLDEVAASAEKELNKLPINNEEDLEKELKDIQKRKKKWQYAWSNEFISDEDFSERMNEERVREEKIKKQIDKTKTNISLKNKNDIYEVIKDIRSNWEKANDHQKKNFIQLFVKQVHFDYDEKGSLYVDSMDFY